VGKRVRSTNLYHSKQCGIVLKPHSDRIDYIAWRTTTAESCENSTGANVQAECGFNEEKNLCSYRRSLLSCPYQTYRTYHPSRFPGRWSRDERTLQLVMDHRTAAVRMRRRRQRWAARCKNALQQLNELKPGLEYRVVSQTGPCHRPVFVVRVQVSGQVS